MPVSAFTDSELAVIRRAYARQMLGVVGVAGDARLEDAFAAVRREDFLGPPPWQVSKNIGYQDVPSFDPVHVYQDVLFALSPERGVNNGSPSLHAKWLHEMALKEGERVCHIGAGSGYYTAIMAQLVGRTGHVLAVEIDPVLAEMARANLAGLSNVSVICGDGASFPTAACDGVYVNFAVERPADAWIDYLALLGRLIFPLGVSMPDRFNRSVRHARHGVGLRIERHASGFAAKYLGPAYFVCAEGDLRASEREAEALRTAFKDGGVEFVKSLVWKANTTPERCWYSGRGWHLSYDAI
jgi:protein-L-isoaspartate(D-aspartate) O-methyltransferase